MKLFVEMLFLASAATTAEIIFNAARKKVINKESHWALKGTTSVWMFPIYMFGLTYGFDVIYQIMNIFSDSSIVRWLSYPFWIWLVELTIGSITNNKLWDYSEIPFNVKGTISLLHFPVWVVFGILIEQLRFLFWYAEWL